MATSEERFGWLIENTKDYAIVIMDAAGFVTDWNRGAASIFGYTSTEIIGQNGAVIFTPEDIAERVPELEREKALAAGHAEDERWHVRKDGSRFWGSGLLMAMHNEAGELQGFAKMLRDASERKRAEEELHETQMHRTAILESALDAIIMMDEQGCIIEFNPAAEHIFGYTRAAAMGQPMADLIIPPALRNEHWCQLAHYRNRDEEPLFQQRLETMGMHADGTEFPVEMSITSVVSGQKQLFIAYVRDISVSKQAAAALHLSEERLQAILDNTTVSVYVKDEQSRYLFVNRGFEEAYGRSRTEIIGQTDYDLGPQDFADAFRAHDLRILALPAPVTMEENVRTHAGKPVTYLSCKFPLRDATGRAYAACGISMDITARKQAEAERAQLLAQEQAARAEAEVARAEAEVARAEAEAANTAKDEFLAMLSHELRTPLTAMMGWVHLLRSGRLDADMTVEGFESIERSIKAQVKLVEDLVDTSRAITGKLSLDICLVELAPLVEAAVDVMRPTALHKGIELQAECEPGTAMVYGDPQRLQQVIWNLLSNAVKFTPGGGQIHVHLRKVDSCMEVEVKDTGCGISPEFLPHVFDRFRQADSSSTRSYGGLGLGLAIVRYLVEKHGGTVRAHSAGEGQGATFIVSLPIPVEGMVDESKDGSD